MAKQDRAPKSGDKRDRLGPRIQPRNPATTNLPREQEAGK